jgi:hypothetical protein
VAAGGVARLSRLRAPWRAAGRREGNHPRRAAARHRGPMRRIRGSLDPAPVCYCSRPCTALVWLVFAKRAAIHTIHFLKYTHRRAAGHSYTPLTFQLKCMYYFQFKNFFFLKNFPLSEKPYTRMTNPTEANRV